MAPLRAFGNAPLDFYIKAPAIAEYKSLSALDAVALLVKFQAAVESFIGVVVASVVTESVI